MKISENSGVNLDAYIQSVTKERIEKEAPQKNEQQDTSFEKIELSSRAKEIQKVKKIVEDAPDIREYKVSKVKEEIEAGTYSVAAKDIAEKMLNQASLDDLI